jgi:hypothetical protein
MDGIFCANFCESRGSLPACRKTWQAGCYECLGKGKFPLRTTTDKEGNLWFRQEQREQRINQGVRGAHASIPFQCKDCWLLNLEGQLLVPRLDDMYVMCIRQANLDAMGGRAVATIKGHAAAVKQTIQNSWLIRKTPTIPHRGPMPLTDNLGMGMAVDMLYNSLSAKPRLKGESFIQFDSMQRPRATFTAAWESLPSGIEEGATFATGTMRVTVTTCPTQQKWFGLFRRGTESRMGYTSQQNQPLGVRVVAKMLEMVLEEVVDQEKHIAKEFMKFGAAAALAMCASLQGNEVFLLDLAGMW